MKQFVSILAFILTSVILVSQGCGEGFRAIDFVVDTSELSSVNEMAKACSGVEPSKSMPTARRLTKYEYLNTLEDLLQVEVQSLGYQLPNDVRTLSFSNQPISLVVSRQHAEAFRDIASEALDRVPNFESYINQNFPSCKDSTESCYREFVNAAAFRIYRRPITSEELDSLTPIYYRVMQEGGDFVESAKMAMWAMLMQPQFLYRLEDLNISAGGKQPIDAYELATRISFLVLQRAPDAELLNAARFGKLEKDEDIQAQVLRLFNKPEAKLAFRNYAFDWLGFAQLGALNIDTIEYPFFNGNLLRDMSEQTLRHLEELVFNERRSLVEAFTDKHTYLNDRTGELYGLNLAGSQFRRVDVSNLQDRGGILTHPSLLMVPLKTDTPSIVQRGYFVTKQFLCQPELPPPSGVDTSPIIASTGTSQRDNLTQSTSSAACMSCHNIINGPGYALESFDIFGRHRTKDEYSNSISTHGDWTIGQVERSWNNTDEFLYTMTEMYQTKLCTAQKVYEHSIGRGLATDDKCGVFNILDMNDSNSFRYDELLMRIATSKAFRVKTIDN